ncbi:MAG: hypothetical protein V4598_05510 [Bdellovibrionota bacterium]
MKFFAPKLQAQYQIFHGDQLIADLKNPVQSDQFWFSFELIPLTTDERLLEILYDDHSWGREIIVKEVKGRVVSFLLQMIGEETETEATFTNILKTRPLRIELRGPY